MVEPNVINREFEYYRAFKYVMRKDERSGYVSVPGWLLSCTLSVFSSEGVLLFSRVAVSSMGRVVLLFPVGFVGSRLVIEYSEV